MTDLSPAAQEVLDALYMDELDGPQQLMALAHAAATLRAVAEHCVPDDSEGHWVYIPHILAIANELEQLP